MRMTVSDLVDTLDWGRLAGFCATDADGVIDDRVYKLVNRASYKMLQRGDWPGSVQLIRFCITNGCITLPRQVERVDVAMLDGAPITVRNQWYNFVEPIGPRCGNGWFSGYGPFNYSGGNFEDRGFYATFRDIIPGSKKIRL